MYSASTIQTREIQCGISSYIDGAATNNNNNNSTNPTTSGPLITGILKQRYSDFQVYEINTNNEKAQFNGLLQRNQNGRDGNNRTSSSNNNSKSTNNQNCVNDNNKRPRNREKLLRRAKRRKVKASLTWQNRNDFWQRYLCGNTNTNNNAGESSVMITDEMVNKIANIPTTFQSKWQHYLVNGARPAYTLTAVQEEALNELETILGKGPVDQFKILLSDKSKIIKFPSSDDKNLRRRVHTAIKAFRSFSVLADTIVEPDTNEKIVRVRCSASSRPDARSHGRKNEKHKFDQRGYKEKWPENLGGEYLQFLLYKENIDTNKALAAIGTLLRIKIKNRLFISGTKDKRATTIQYVTGYRLKPNELALINQRHGGPCGNLWIGSNVNYVKSKTYLGNLKGNEFHIVLRDVHLLGMQSKNKDDSSITEKEMITKIVKKGAETIKEKGFINYFGLQRFGTGIVPTHLVGMSVLKRDWKKAIDLIMTGGTKERQDIAKAREAYRDGKISQSLRMMPRHMHTESTVLKNLKKQQERQSDENKTLDYSAALNALPRHLTQLYTHAYQSYVWNRLVSERLNSSSDCRKVLVGDLIIIAKTTSIQQGNETANNGNCKAKKNLEEIECDYVTTKDIENDKYTIDDVVFPLPGKSTKYPNNVYGERMVNIMKGDGITIDDLQEAAKVDTSFHGSYRKIIQRAKNVSFEVKSYKGKNNDELCKTGLEELLNKERQNARNRKNMMMPNNNKDHGRGNRSNNNNIVSKLEEKDEIDRIAVILKFQLPKSTYATMCLREISMTST